MNDDIMHIKKKRIKEEFGVDYDDDGRSKEGNDEEDDGRVEGGRNEILSLDLPNVIEVLVDKDELCYLTKDLGIKKEIISNGTIHKPPPKDKCPYTFPEKDETLKLVDKWRDEDNKRLYNDLFSYHRNISDLPDDDFYHLLVIWDFHVWLLDKCHFSPYLYFFAARERGKSRTVKGLVYLARRGIFTETVREADIIRWGNDHKAVLGFDTKDFPKKIVRANCDDLILTRFERGAIASRTMWPERGAFRDTKTFELFGSTLIATNRPVDDILESRSISIDMKPTNKVFGKPVLPKDAQKLKNKLASFRIVNFDKDLLPAKPQALGRLGDITLPLYQIVITFFPDKEDIFLRLLNKIEKKKRNESTDTLEAQVLQAVINLNTKVQGGKISVELIANTFNSGKSDNFAITNRTVGQVLKGLGFDKRRMTGGKSGIYYDIDLLKKLSFQYGLSEINDDGEEGLRKDVGNDYKTGKRNDGVSRQRSLISLTSSTNKGVVSKVKEDFGQKNKSHNSKSTKSLNYHNNQVDLVDSGEMQKGERLFTSPLSRGEMGKRPGQKEVIKQ